MNLQKSHRDLRVMAHSRYQIIIAQKVIYQISRSSENRIQFLQAQLNNCSFSF